MIRFLEVYPAPFWIGHANLFFSPPCLLKKHHSGLKYKPFGHFHPSQFFRGKRHHIVYLHRIGKEHHQAIDAQEPLGFPGTFDRAMLQSLDKALDGGQRRIGNAAGSSPG